MYQLRLLGPVQVMREEQLVQGFESRKALALLCYLATRLQPLSRAHLVDLFWPDKSEARGRGNLSRVLNNLSSLLPHSLIADRETVQLDDAQVWLDTCTFDDLAGQNLPEALAGAVDLYRDEFMAGMYLDECPEFEVWLVGERERWRQRMVSVLECLTGHHARRGAYEKALPFAARLLDLEPWREEAHRQMMQLLARTGQRSAALQQYETCRRVLAQELSAEPSAELMTLRDQIRAEDITSAVRVPSHNLPVQLTSFIGRETDLVRIAARLNNPDSRLLTLVGPGGIGKTRLALEAAGNLRDSFREGVYFVPLASIAAGNSEFIVSAIANAIGFTFAGPEEPNTQLLHHLREKHCLLLLDNFEHLLDGVRLVIDILQQAPQVKILATSREPLNLQAEWLLHIAGLHYPTTHTQSNEELLRYSAVHLFVERVNRVQEEFALNAETRSAVLRICQIVEGMPLAIELAATAIKLLPVGKIATQIASNVDLGVPMHDREMRHWSLRSVLDWSYGLLSDAEQALFRQLSVFAGGWTLEAAEAVCAKNSTEAHRILDLLSSLASKSLVAREHTHGETRYRMLEPVRQYAHDKLFESHEVEWTGDRHLDYFLRLAEEAESMLHGPKQVEWLERLGTEHDNLRNALGWCKQSGKPELELKLAGALGWFWYVRGYQREGLDWLEGILARSQSVGETAERARALNAAGTLALRAGNLASAQSLLEESIRVSSNLSPASRWNLAYTLNELGALAHYKADVTSARAYLQESRRIWTELGSSGKWGMVTALLILGEIARTGSDYREADELYHQALALCEEIGNKHLLSISRLNLGYVRLHQGDYQKAKVLFRDAIMFLREMQATKFIACGLAGIGGVLRREGHTERAARLLGAASATLESIGVLMDPADRIEYDLDVAAVHDQLGEKEFANAWADRRSLTLEHAIAYALESI